jgi:hypothetical protein
MCAAPMSDSQSPRGNLSPRGSLEDLMQVSGATRPTSEPLESDSLSSRLTREQVVDRIITINPTATVSFLERFNSRSLGMYLDHLVSASRPRGRGARWLRPGDTPAILGRESQD